MATVVMANMMTQTMGKALNASLIAISRQGLMLIPALFILGPLFGLLGIQFATPVADMASLIIVIPILRRTLKQLSAPDAVPGSTTGRTRDSDQGGDQEVKEMIADID